MNNKNWAKTCAAATLALAVSLPGMNVEAAVASKLMPLRAFADAVGATISWDGAAQAASVEWNGANIAFPIGANSVKVGDKEVALDQLVQLVNDRTMVSQQAIRAVFGWEAADKALARQFMTDLQAGNVAKLQENMTGALKAVPAAVLMQLWGSTASAGALKGIAKEQTAKTEGIEHVVLTYQFEKGLLDVRLRLIDGLVDDVKMENSNVFGQTYTKPAYDTGDYTERDVLVGSGTDKLPGTLTVPKGAGPFPVVILVQGSGPSDRDEAIGAIKPFRDLAVGLAAQGIATLRYDKRTYELPLHSLFTPNLTVKDETVNDVMAAVDLMSQTEGIDGKRIVVMGHSLGASLVPRFKELDKDGKIAGLISAAGPARKFGEVVSEQADYLMSVKALPEAQGLALKEQAKLTMDPNLKDDGTGRPIMGAPISYWLDFGNYVATDLAKKQSGPLLVLQGAKDYQVTVQDFELWKKELAGRTDVTYKLYPNMIHGLVDIAAEKSLPTDAVKPANVPSVLIEDIANWIKTQVK